MLAGSAAVIVTNTLPLLGGAISEAALTTIVVGVLEIGVAGIVESAVAPALMNFLDVVDDYAWAFEHPDDVIDTLPAWLTPVQQQFNQGAEEMYQQYSPLVLDLDGDGIELTSFSGPGAVYFDIDNDNFKEVTGWVTGGDGLLAQDRNGNGMIDNKGELFGDTASAANGFISLKALDSNNDNRITSADTQWNTLRVWPARAGAQTKIFSNENEYKFIMAA